MNKMIPCAEGIMLKVVNPKIRLYTPTSHVVYAEYGDILTVIDCRDPHGDYGKVNRNFTLILLHPLHNLTEFDHMSISSDLIDARHGFALLETFEYSLDRAEQLRDAGIIDV